MDNNIFENDEMRIIHPDDAPKPSVQPAPEPQPEPEHVFSAAAPSKEASTNYVTKKFFVMALVIAMLVTSVLSSVIAVHFSQQSGSFRNLSSSSLDKATGSKLTLSEIIAKNEDSVVEITTSIKGTDFFGQTTVQQGAGSGVIVNEKGYIVTNYHVVKGASDVKVRLHNGDNHSASIIGSDPDNDIAVIKISASDLKAVTIGDSSTMNVGDMTVAIGNPLGQLGGTATQGIVSALERRLTIDNTTLTLLQTDAAINPGNSGGGLFNGAGELIGIVVAKSSGTGVEGLGFAIPINSVANLIDDLIADGKVSDKPSIGITIIDVTEENKNHFGVDTAGIYISQVTSEEARSAGIKEGDRLISLNGKKFESSKEFISLVRKSKVGDTVTVVVERGGKEYTIKTVLVESTVTN